MTLPVFSEHWVGLWVAEGSKKDQSHKRDLPSSSLGQRIAELKHYDKYCKFQQCGEGGLESESGHLEQGLLMDHAKTMGSKFFGKKE
jgi:hypothetical protein